MKWFNVKRLLNPTLLAVLQEHQAHGGGVDGRVQALLLLGSPCSTGQVLRRVSDISPYTSTQHTLLHTIHFYTPYTSTHHTLLHSIHSTHFCTAYTAYTSTQHTILLLYFIFYRGLIKRNIIEHIHCIWFSTINGVDGSVQTISFRLFKESVFGLPALHIGAMCLPLCKPVALPFL